jgi:hypothetical protein
MKTCFTDCSTEYVIRLLLVSHNHEQNNAPEYQSSFCHKNYLYLCGGRIFFTRNKNAGIEICTYKQYIYVKYTLMTRAI